MNFLTGASVSALATEVTTGKNSNESDSNSEKQ